jgi:hypothetical protein
MSENVIAFFQFVGFLISAYFVIVGAYIVLRWGTIGVTVLWGKRTEIDEIVDDEFRKSWRIR